MKIEDLLIPRVKVIADFWNNPFQVGLIIIFEKGSSGEWIAEYAVYDGLQKKRLHQFIDFPHLFQPLPWHAERSESEMPEYVKVDFGGGAWKGKIGKAKFSKKNTNVTVWFNDIDHHTFHRSDTFPATESEYNTFINNK